MRKRMQMNRALFLFLVCMTAVVAVACSPEIRLLDDSKLKDLSLLSGEPCEAPCWNEITPGETSYVDAKTIIEDDWRYQNVEEAEQQEGNPARIFGFTPEEGQVCCQVFSRDGQTVTSMLLQLAPQMTLGPVMDAHGEPAYVGGDSPAADQAYMALVYEDVPMVVYAFVTGAESGMLSSSSEIIGVMVMAQSEMDTLLSCSSLYDWAGFQSFSNYIDDNYDYVGEHADDEALCGTG